jgi:squalene synthase HpnC
MPSPLPAASATAAPITHYENFPVASWLCPAHLRAPIAAIYHFARTADDIADEGDASPAERLASLRDYRQALQQAADGGTAFADWPQVFGPLQAAIQQHALPVQLLHDLLDAFVQDIEKTRDGTGYADDAALHDYCRRSANPVGRLLLHLYGVNDAQALLESDAICTALQLINFWQDLSVDIPRGRYYLPEDMHFQSGVSWVDMTAQQQITVSRELILACTQVARGRMLRGGPLVHRIPGRAGWELRLVVQGGLRILDKIEAAGGMTLFKRPTIRWWDAPVMLWRAIWM